MAQVIAIQATVAQMNLSKRRNIGVPFPLRHARSLGQKSEPGCKINSPCRLNANYLNPAMNRGSSARRGLASEFPSPPLAGRG